VTEPGATSVLLHATAIAIGSSAVLIQGPSGSGKSDLALRVLALHPGALSSFGFQDLGPIRLVADDQVRVTIRGARLLASAPPTISGLLEVRGVGIVKVRTQADAEIRLVVRLVTAAAVQRLPEADACVEILGHTVPTLDLDPVPASAPLKLVLALLRRCGG
jgi:HPr kinase/phosphorylase